MNKDAQGSFCLDNTKSQVSDQREEKNYTKTSNGRQRELTSGRTTSRRSEGS